jgi:CubicO group peptidase (beta-lactamase class C family)
MRLRNTFFILGLGAALAPLAQAHADLPGPKVVTGNGPHGAALAPTTVLTACPLESCTGDIGVTMWRQSIEVAPPGRASLAFRATTAAVGVTALKWEIVPEMPSGAVPIASGTQKLSPSQIAEFTVATPFLKPAPKTKYVVRTHAMDANNKVVEEGNVVHIAPAGPSKPTDFTRSAVFPSAELVSFVEKIGNAPLTQIMYSGADVTLRVTNREKSKTDPITVGVTDTNGFMRAAQGATIPALAPNESRTVAIHLDAVLPPTNSQLASTAHILWLKKYQDGCGTDLRVNMGYDGNQSDVANPYQVKMLPTEGFGYYPNAGRNSNVCEGNYCLNVCGMGKAIQKALDGHVVGYSFAIGQHPWIYASGEARTKADGVSIPFTTSTRMTVASVSKFVTALTAVRVLAKAKVSLDSPIGPYLPSDWHPSDHVKNKVTFRQLMNQTSGVMNYGNVPQDYAALKRLWTWPVNANAKTVCTDARPEYKALANDAHPENTPINPNFKGATNPAGNDFCYSNYNAALMRLILPRVAGSAEDPNLTTRPITLAAQYTKLAQQHVFEPVGQVGVACSPSGGPHAFAYRYPGSAPGLDWGDVSTQCGAAGWYLSAEDMAKVLLQLGANDKATHDLMFGGWLGIDQEDFGGATGPGTYFYKNGGWGEEKGRGVTTVVAGFGATHGPESGPRAIGVLFVNSNISGGPFNDQGADSVLIKAYKDNVFKR